LWVGRGSWGLRLRGGVLGMVGRGAVLTENM